MAAAAAAAIAAASASVTRGIRPIEPISPMTRANRNIVMPAKLSDAIKEKDTKLAVAPATETLAPKNIGDVKASSGRPDDLKRIRGIGVLIEKRLNALGITTYTEVANWSSSDIDRISQTLDFKGRIERENWVEQARILSSGGHTEFSRRFDRGDVETSRDDD
jgi:predicted flap endonuclease-1-like 5' DNA nuclease